jgi:hypothetical protein
LGLADKDLLKIVIVPPGSSTFEQARLYAKTFSNDSQAEIDSSWAIQTASKKFIFSNNFYENNPSAMQDFIFGKLMAPKERPPPPKRNVKIHAPSSNNASESSERSKLSTESVAKRFSKKGIEAQQFHFTDPEKLHGETTEDTPAVVDLDERGDIFVNGLYIDGRFARLEIMHKFLLRESKEYEIDGVLSPEYKVIPNQISFLYSRLTVLEYLQLYIKAFGSEERFILLQKHTKDMDISTVFIEDLLCRESSWKKRLGLNSLYVFRKRWLLYLKDLILLNLLLKNKNQYLLKLFISTKFSLLHQVTTAAAPFHAVFPSSIALNADSICNVWRYWEYSCTSEFTLTSGRIKKRDSFGNDLPLTSLLPFRAMWEFPMTLLYSSAASFFPNTNAEQPSELLLRHFLSQSRTWHLTLGFLLAHVKPSSELIQKMSIEVDQLLTTISWFFYPWPGCLFYAQQLATLFNYKWPLDMTRLEEMISKNCKSVFAIVAWLSECIYGSRPLQSMSYSAVLRRERLARSCSSLEGLSGLVHRFYDAFLVQEAALKMKDDADATGVNFLNFKSFALRFDRLHSHVALLSENRRRDIMYDPAVSFYCRNDILVLQDAFKVIDIASMLADTCVYKFTTDEVELAICWKNDRLAEFFSIDISKSFVNNDQMQIVLAVAKFHQWIENTSDSSTDMKLSERLLQFFPLQKPVIELNFDAFNESILYEASEFSIILDDIMTPNSGIDLNISLAGEPQLKRFKEAFVPTKPPTITVQTRYADVILTNYIETHPGLSLSTLQLLLWPLVHPIELSTYLDILLKTGKVMQLSDPVIAFVPCK